MSHCHIVFRLREAATRMILRSSKMLKVLPRWKSSRLFTKCLLYNKEMLRIQEMWRQRVEYTSNHLILSRQVIKRRMAVDWAAEMWTGNFGGKKLILRKKQILRNRLLWRKKINQEQKTNLEENKFAGITFKNLMLKLPHYQAKVQPANQQISNIYV